MESAQKRR